MPLEVTADRLVYREKAGIMFLSGKVQLKFKEYQINGDKAWIDKNNQTASFQGKVRVTSADFTVESQVLKVFYKESRLVFTGGVDFQSRKELLLEKGDLPAPGRMTCDNLEYNWQTMNGNASGQVRGVSGNKRFQADRLLYLGGKKELTLNGNARLERGDQEYLAGEEILFDLKDQSATVNGGVRGSVLLQEKGFKLTPAPNPAGAQGDKTP